MTSQSFRLSHEETISKICNKTNGIFMYAREVLSQLEENPTLDLEGLPKGLGVGTRSKNRNMCITYANNRNTRNQQHKSMERSLT